MTTEIRIEKGKQKGSFRVYRSYKKDGWEGSGNLMDLMPVDGFLVGIAFITKPVAVFTSIENAVDRLRSAYGVEPILKI